jgi:hypothetical protein
LTGNFDVGEHGVFALVHCKDDATLRTLDERTERQMNNKNGLGESFEGILDDVADMLSFLWLSVLFFSKPREIAERKINSARFIITSIMLYIITLSKNAFPNAAWGKEEFIKNCMSSTGDCNERYVKLLAPYEEIKLTSAYILVSISILLLCSLLARFIQPFFGKHRSVYKETTSIMAISILLASSINILTRILFWTTSIKIPFFIGIIVGLGYFLFWTSKPFFKKYSRSEAILMSALVSVITFIFGAFAYIVVELPVEVVPIFIAHGIFDFLL